MIRVKMFGGFALSVDGSPIATVNSPRLQSLLALLILNRKAPLSRRQIAAIFWPEVSEAHARNNLRQSIHHLREALPDPDRFLRGDTHTLAWSVTQTHFELDIDEFEHAIDAGLAARDLNDRATMLTLFERSIALYHDDILPDCYDDWIANTRESLRRKLCNTLALAAEEHEHLLQPDAAIPLARRLTVLNRLDDDAHDRLMRLYAGKRDRAGVVSAFGVYATAMQDELGIAPGPEMRARYEHALRLAESPAGRAPTANESHDAITALVGRRREWEALRDAWKDAKSGRAQLVLIRGEAGIGKTRLAEELMALVNRDGGHYARSRAYAADGRLAYAPIAGLLRNEVILGDIQRLAAPWLADVARLLPEILTDQSNPSVHGDLREPLERLRFCEALARAVLMSRKPVLLVIDDLQWCDVETLEWLRYLVDYASNAPVLLVGTLRAEEVDQTHPVMRTFATLLGSPRMIEISLEPLDSHECATLASAVAKRSLDGQVTEWVLRQAEGNPLFIIELVRARQVDSGVDVSAPNSELPQRIQALIRYRFSLLSVDAKEVMHLAAVAGRAVGLEVLTAAARIVENEMLTALDELCQRRILRTDDGRSYDFAHDLLREAALHTLGPARRRMHSQRTAEAIETVNAGILDAECAQLAALYEHAGDAIRALEYYKRAVEYAARLYAHDEIETLATRARAILPSIADERQRDALELPIVRQLALAIGVSDLRVARQYSALERAQQLSEKLGHTIDPVILRALAINKLVGNDFEACRRIGGQLIEFGNQNGDRALLLQGHKLLGLVLSWRGEFRAANRNLELAIENYEPARSAEYITAYSWEPYVTCHSRMALNLWCLGHPEAALATLRLATEAGRQFSHAFSVSYAAMWEIKINLISGNAGAALANAEEALAFSNRHAALWWMRFAALLRCCALIGVGRYNEGIAAAPQVLADWLNIGSTLNQSLLYGYLARAYAATGEAARALEALDTAAELCVTKDSWYEAEIHRLRAETLIATDVHAAESSYLQALAVARSQEARTFEMRAALGLANLMAADGRSAQIPALLRPLSESFIEADAPPELAQARALLAQVTVW